MTSEEAKALWGKIKANTKALANCQGPHEFVGDETGAKSKLSDGTLYQHFVCTKCKGRISLHDKTWYERGLEHGRKAQ